MTATISGAVGKEVAMNHDAVNRWLMTIVLIAVIGVLMALGLTVVLALLQIAEIVSYVGE